MQKSYRGKSVSCAQGAKPIFRANPEGIPGFYKCKKMPIVCHIAVFHRIWCFLAALEIFSLPNPFMVSRYL